MSEPAAPVDPSPALTPARIDMVDAARLLGLAFVYYGHFVEQIMYLGNPAAAAQYKFIYSFHMVLFFVLSGFVFKQKDLELPIGRFLKLRFMSRLVPFIFFNLFMVFWSLCIPGNFFDLNLPSVKGYLNGGLLTLFGLTLFNVPTWFLLCLFSVELIHYLVGRFIPNNRAILLAAFGFYLAGYYFNLAFHVFDVASQKVVFRNYLYIHEAVVMYAFYLAGIFLRQEGFLQRDDSRVRNLALVVAALVFELAVYDLNQGPFRLLDAVVIMFSGHGNVGLFPVTALVGSLMVMLMAKTLLQYAPSARNILIFMGRNGLIVYCLNGVFYHFVNGRVAALFAAHTPSAGWSVFLASAIVTVLSLALCYPMVRFFIRWTPQLVGRPAESGPLLPAFVRTGEPPVKVGQ